MVQKGEKPHPREKLRNRGTKKSEKGRIKCEKYKQAQAAISVQKFKRKSYRRRKTIPLNDRSNKDFGYEERVQRKASRRKESQEDEHWRNWCN